MIVRNERRKWAPEMNLKGKTSETTSYKDTPENFSSSWRSAEIVEKENCWRHTGTLTGMKKSNKKNVCCFQKKTVCLPNRVLTKKWMKKCRISSVSDFKASSGLRSRVWRNRRTGSELYEWNGMGGCMRVRDERNGCKRLLRFHQCAERVCRESVQRAFCYSGGSTAVFYGFKPVTQ